jgi:hypothetical protein
VANIPPRASAAVEVRVTASLVIVDLRRMKASLAIWRHSCPAANLSMAAWKRP